MEPKVELARIIGLAKIVSYEMTFDSISYVIQLRECDREMSDLVERISDYQISMNIPFSDHQTLIHALRNPVFIYMQESWEAGEEDCHFEYKLEDMVAMMILNGRAVLVPV